MTTNSELQIIFERLASGIALRGGNQFRAVSHQRVARLLRDMTKDVGSIVADDPGTAEARLQALPGIGKGAARRIIEYLDTGEITEHTELLEHVPETVFDLLQIPGLGPKAVKTLWQDLGVENATDLRAAIESGKVEDLPRMGKKTVENILKNLDFNTKQHARVPIGKALPLALQIVGRLEAADNVKEAHYAGSLRRGRDTIGDLDFIASTSKPAAVREMFLGMPEVKEIIASGETKCSVRLKQGGATGVDIQADLRMVPPAVLGAAMMYFTGSKEHNVRLREICVKRKWRLNEYGLFEGTEERPQDEGKKPLAAKTERQIYQKLDLPYIPPELREDRGEIQSPSIDLVEIGHIQAELHAHTTASDGKMELEEIVEQALDRGFTTLAITDHSVSSVLANGLDAARLAKHAKAIRRLNEQLDQIDLLAGVEVDILVDGSLDFEDAILAELDWVVASPHVSLQQEPQEATDRLLRAVDNPHVHVLGHPTGRKVGRRAGLAPNLDLIFSRASANGVAMEVNANPTRLDLRAQHVRSALEHGCLIAIDTDAHVPRHFDYLHFGITTARRGWLTKDQCINTWDRERLTAWRSGGRREE